MMELLVDQRCLLGEGPLYADGRLYWFDILARRLHSSDLDGGALEECQFAHPVSAAGRLADGRLLVASSRGLMRFDPASGTRELIAPLEEDDPATRSNDGRADRHGGFWIGTMGLEAEPGRGSLYRFFGGTLRRLRSGLGIPNAICFAPDGRTAYFADTSEATIWSWTLDSQGWPLGEPTVFVRVAPDRGGPDGAVVDREGCIWNARWGAGLVVRHAPDGREIERLELPVSQPTCPAFGGPDNRTLFVTSARVGLDPARLGDEPHAGGVFTARLAVAGLPEPVVEN